MNGQTIVNWMFVHPWMTFFIILAIAEAIGNIGRTEIKCNKCDD
jgi:hypothetical protein